VTTDADTARRERAEQRAEIAALQQNDANREALLDSLLRLRNEHILEIAALREANEIDLGEKMPLLVKIKEKDAEIGRLESLLDRARPLARKNLEQAAEIEELKAEIATLNESITLQRVGIDALKRTNDKLNEENERLKDQRNAALRVIPMESLDEIRPVLYACAAGDISGGKALELLREWMETGSLDGFDGYALHEALTLEAASHSAAEIERLKRIIDDWYKTADDRAAEIIRQAAEIAALREKVKALEGLISGAIQHSWSTEDYEKFWVAVNGWEKP